MAQLKQAPPKIKKKNSTVEAGTKVTWLVFSTAVVALAAVLYVNTLQNSYALDDKGIITQNKFTSRGFSGIPNLLTTSYWEGIDKNVRSYRPLAPVTFAAEVGFWGMNPAASHFFNMVIYMLTGIVLLFFLKRLFEKADPAIPPVIPFITTLLFLAHPIHTEVVANIKSRDTMFELFFLLLSGYFLLRYISTGKRVDLVISVSSFFPALLSKESAITYLVMVPVMLILFDDRPFLKKLQTTSFYLIPALLFLMLFIRYSNIQEYKILHIMDNALVAPGPPGEIWATKFLILGKYLALLIYPHPLVYDYSYNQIPRTVFSDPSVLLSVLVYFSAVVFLLFILQKKISGKKVDPAGLIAAFSIAWFIMGFFASSNLILLIGSTMGERFMYAPSLGFLLLFVYFLHKALRTIDRTNKPGGVPAVILYIMCAIILAGYTYKTTDRNKAWKDDFTLFSTDIKYLGQNTKANDFLSGLYKKEAEKASDPVLKNNYYIKAIEFKEKALSIYPKVPEIQQQLGYLYGITGQFEKAVNAYKAAIELNPGEITNYIQAGKAYGMIQNFYEGIVYLQKAEKIDPENADLLASLGISYAQTGELEKAIAYFERALAKDPSNKQVAGYLAYAKNQAGLRRR